MVACWRFNSSERSKIFKIMSKLIYRTKPPKEAMHDLAEKLDKLGYDPTKMKFEIHYKI